MTGRPFLHLLLLNIAATVAAAVIIAKVPALRRLVAGLR